MQNRAQEPPGVVVTAFWVEFGRCRKSMFFGIVPRHPKISKNHSLERPRAEKDAATLPGGCPVGVRWVPFCGVGAWGSSRARDYY